MPVIFNESEINEVANIIGDDFFGTTLDTNTTDHSYLGSAHPSPDCSINHLDYDCDNHFCPYYVEKENIPLLDQRPLAQDLPAYFSDCSTPQANSPLTVISNNSPRVSKDKGNITSIQSFTCLVKDWIDVKRKTLRNLGKEYLSRKGVVKASRKMGPPRIFLKVLLETRRQGQAVDVCG